MQDKEYSRREALRGAGMSSVGMALAMGASMPGLPAHAAGGEGAAKPWFELELMPDPILNQVLLFYLGGTWQKMSDIGECLQTASRVDGADPYSWSREWQATARRLVRTASESRKGGHAISAGEVDMRAANYFIAALHRHPDPWARDVAGLTREAEAAYRRALQDLPLGAEPVAIPYETTKLPGYFFAAPGKKRGRAPLVIAFNGRDAWAEQCKYIAEAANARGMHCLIFDGPGQGKVIRLQGLPFRPDWENVVRPVVDFAVRMPGVDPNRIALMGLSMGGALAPRAAAFEHRLKLCIANPGILNWRDVIRRFFEEALGSDMLALAERNPGAFDRRMKDVMASMPLIAWGVTDSMWKHGVRTPSALIADMNRYRAEDVVDRIRCRTLVMDGEMDEFSQARALFEKLRCPKDFILFTREETAMLHNQVGALAVSTQRSFDWIEAHI
ncbi:alpha/beta hydrolase family protein [Sphingobium lignivorans]|uniref:Alpha/beta hydrolase n=1 Tax=Sphingobium lignivorans TaxID=2735886 RepID=A0ABR6NBX5_9SPHN|nr:alpha/beta fold hydrolase [Sphingobium lignivorans]MBB5984792.1 putative alpha/beta hydrolase [Sphingobium lignivorans]